MLKFFCRVVGLALVTVFIAQIASAQTSSIASAQQDTRALAVLNQMALRSGWWISQLPQSAMVTGRYTAGNGKTGDFRLSVTQSSEYIQEVSSPSGVSIETGSSTHGSLKDLNVSRVHRAGRHSPPPTLPFLVGVVGDPASTKLTYGGIEEIHGHLTYKIEMILSGSSADGSDFQRKTIWISTTSFLPEQIEYFVPADNNPSIGFKKTRSLSGYRVVSGLAVPFLQEEFIGGQFAFRLEVSEVSFATSDSTLTGVHP